MFRFHTGSIKSELVTEGDVGQIRFDSILVRLKDADNLEPGLD